MVKRTLIILIALVALPLGILSLAGIRPFVLRSDSMEPDYHNGSLIFADTGAAFDSLKEGDVIVFSGDRSPGIPFMMGYADNTGDDGSVLLGNFEATDYSNLSVTEEEITIPTGISYVRCSARNTSLQGWANRNMSVIKRAFNLEEQTIRIFTVGNSFSADVVESFLFDMAANGETMYRKSLEAAVAGQAKAREKLMDQLPEDEWEFD